MVQTIQDSRWADENSSIIETRFTLESVSEISVNMNDLVAMLYNRGISVDVNELPQLQELRAMFPGILFHKIDVSEENPYAYKIKAYDPRTRMDNYRNYTGQQLGELTSEITKDAASFAYAYTAFNKTPRLALVEKSTGDDTRRYLHLIWPLSENGKITQILVAACYQEFAIQPSVFESSINIGPYEISGAAILRWWKKRTPIKAQLAPGMAINSKRESTAVKICKIVGHNVVDAVIN